MSKTYFKSIINKFLSIFSGKDNKPSSDVNNKNLDIKDENSDDIYPLW